MSTNATALIQAIISCSHRLKAVGRNMGATTSTGGTWGLMKSQEFKDVEGVKANMFYATGIDDVLAGQIFNDTFYGLNISDNSQALFELGASEGALTPALDHRKIIEETLDRTRFDVVSINADATIACAVLSEVQGSTEAAMQYRKASKEPR